MALGRQGDRQGDLVVTWKEMPRSPGHVFYDRLQGVRRYFRMHMVGYFEGINSERGIERRCADSLSLREFLRLRTTAGGRIIPGSKTRSRLPQ